MKTTTNNTLHQVPITFCPTCEISSITYRDLDQDGNIRVFCLECNTDIGAERDVDEVLGGPLLLDTLGYEVKKVKPKGGAGGCRTEGGGGCSGCGTKTTSPATDNTTKKPFRA